jgi:uncharacterized protein YbjT (DUF2867 family)
MIVVTAPTGQIGSQVVLNLLAADAPVRLVVRDADSLSAEVRNRVEIVEGSHGDAATIDRALGGADALFWLAPPDASKTLDQAYLEFTGPVVDSIRKNGTVRVVTITALGRGTQWEDRAGLVTASIAMEDLLMSAGSPFRGLAMPSFMENTVRQAGVMKEKGMFFGPIDPDRRMPFTATRDMAAVAARWLVDYGWGGQEEVPVLGPEDLSFNDQAAIISQVIGREIRYVQIPFEQFRRQFIDRGASESFAQGYTDMYRAKDEGIDNVAGRNAAETGPTTFREFCETVIKPLFA